MPRPTLGLAVLFTAAFTTITTETLPMGLLPAMGRSLAASESQSGLLVAAYAFLITVVTLPLAALTSRWRRRRLLIVIIGAFACGNILMALAPTYPIAVVARLVAGLGHGVLWSMMASYATRLVAPEKSVAPLTVAQGGAVTIAATMAWGTAMPHSPPCCSRRCSRPPRTHSRARPHCSSSLSTSASAQAPCSAARP